MKRLLIWIFISLSFVNVYAGHIAGGEMYYVHVGTSNLNNNTYQITLRLFRECNPVGTAAPLPDLVKICIYRGINQIPDVSEDVHITDYQILQYTSSLKCVIHPPSICYQVATYSFTADLPVVPDDYTCAYQTCCRSNSIVNVQQLPIAQTGLQGEGSTYSCTIPGTTTLPSGTNSSAVFALKDTVLLCAKNKLSLDFSASDPDHDSLSYSFCAAYNRGASVDADTVTPSAPPYQSVKYIGSYSGIRPLGISVQIDAVTGEVTGQAPAAGAYVVSVCVAEWRKGTIISIHSKDFIVRVSDCDIPAALLPPVYTNCDSFNVKFSNESTSSGIDSYYWDFGLAGQTSTMAEPVFTYTDTGIYTAKLIINKGERCPDSAITQVRIYPGFKPDFIVPVACVNGPAQFKDATVSPFGIPDEWTWHFEDGRSTDDNSSTLQNPEYIFKKTGIFIVEFSVANSVGCSNTISKPVKVNDELAITLPFTDTLICKKESLLLSATGDENSSYSWQPAKDILNENTQTPVVFPDTTTLYIVTVSDGIGCVNKDSITVHVIDHATLKIGKNTTICLTDTIAFNPVSNAIYFSWTPDSTLSSLVAKTPFAVPAAASETYYLRASISATCFADDSITVKTLPYPEADAGNDVSVCFGYAAQLHASYKGSSFSWSPTNALLNPTTLSPTAGPQHTTTYILTVIDTSVLSCPKPVSDSLTVTIIPLPNVFAGNDTNIVINQPLQLHATGAKYYSWQPIIDIDNPQTPDPTLTMNGEPHTIQYHVKGITAEGCVGYDSLTVSVYKTLPNIFIPSAFTPNGDGLNDKLIPIAAGIQKVEMFGIYNRFGQLLYSTAKTGDGWNGNANGIRQPNGTYVYVVKAIDYLGKTILKKGTIVLVR